MLSPDAKEIWKSKAGASLMHVMLGAKAADEGDRAIVEKLIECARQDDQAAEPGAAES